MIFKGKPRFEQLDQYLAKREYGLALEAIMEEIKHRPENFNLLLRQAEILGQAGDREQAVTIYRKLARHYTDQGFYARAIAVTNKILQLDPERKEVTAELAELIAAQKESDRASRERLEQATAPPPAAREPHAETEEFAPPGPGPAAPQAEVVDPVPPEPEQLEPEVLGPAELESEEPELGEPEPAEPQLEEPEPEAVQLAPPPATDEEPPIVFTDADLGVTFEDGAREPAREDEAVETEATSPPGAQEEQHRREREASEFFASFPQEALEELLSSTSVQSFQPGEVIVSEGDPGTSMFLIESGSVEVKTRDPRGAEVTLAVLGPGEFFGEVAVLSGVPRTATIIAREVVSTIEISRELLQGIAEHHPHVREILERFYRKRAEATVETMLTRLRGGNA